MEDRSAVVATPAARPQSGRASPRGGSDGTPPAWVWPFLVYVPLEAWRDLLARDLPALLHAEGVAPRLPAGTLVAVGVAAVAAGALAEAAFYGMLWGARGVRLPFRATALAALELTLFEALAQRWLERLDPASRSAPIAALFVGARACWPGQVAPSTAAAAFGSFGLFTLARIGLFASVQARALARPFREAVTPIALAWIATHVAQVWVLQLLAGQHPRG